tara:strand:+ start:98376 stop:98597 length:222 start_codon:yes stop_codon:yes gene_type:complete
MDYNDLIETISEMVENEKINKRGLTLVYTLNEKNHKQMDEHLFYTSNPENTEFVHQEVIEVTLGGIMVKFIKE